jgi:hypothetical protein
MADFRNWPTLRPGSDYEVVWRTDTRRFLSAQSVIDGIQGMLQLTALATAAVAFEQIGRRRYRDRDPYLFVDPLRPGIKISGEYRRRRPVESTELLTTVLDEYIFVSRVSYRNPLESAAGIVGAAPATVNSIAGLVRLTLERKKILAEGDVAELEAIIADATLEYEVDRIAHEVEKLAEEVRALELDNDYRRLRNLRERLELAVALIQAERELGEPRLSLSEALAVIDGKPGLGHLAGRLAELDVSVEAEPRLD